MIYRRVLKKEKKTLYTESRLKSVATMLLQFLIAGLLPYAFSQEGTSAKASKELEIKLQNYDKHLRPYADVKPLAVQVQVALVDLGPINEQDFSFQADLFLRQWWHDPRLTFSAGSVNFNGNPKNLIWLPDMFIRNSRKTLTHKQTMETIRTKVDSDGTVFMSSRITAICTCKMHLQDFPMDRQKCDMVFESYAYNSSFVNLIWHETPIEYLEGYQQIEGYKLLKIEATAYPIKYVTGEIFSLLDVGFNVERTFLYYVFSIYLPSTFLVAITWGTFYVPPTSYPARCGLIVTNFLATLFILQGASKLIPRVPYATAIEIYLLVNTIFIAMVVIEYMVVIQVTAKGINKRIQRISRLKNSSSTEKVEIQLINDTNGTSTEITDNKEKKKEKRPPRFHPVDKLSMVLIPSLYFLFLIIYFAYYL